MLQRALAPLGISAPFGVVVSRLLLLGLGSGALAAPLAADVQFQTLLDLDVGVSTGCDVATAAGVFGGVEEIWRTTVDTDVVPPRVVALERQACVNPATDTFGPPSAVAVPFSPPWDLGVALAPPVDADVVETYVVLAAGIPSVRVGFTSETVGGGVAGDALLSVDGGAASGPILLAVASVVEIPTLGEWALLALALGLVGFGLAMLRRRRDRVAFALALLAVTAGLGVAWAAIVPDGGVVDWGSDAPVATDPSGDGVPGGDFLRAYARDEGQTLFLRFDLAPNAAPTADDQAISVDEDSVANAITLTGSDPDVGDTLTLAIATGPTHGALGGVPPNVTYTPNADYAGPDSFTFTVDDGNGGVDTGTVSITVDPQPDAPIITSPAVVNATENQTMVLDVQSTDIDGETEGAGLGYALTGGADQALFSIAPATGVLTFLAAPDFENPTDAGGDNVYDVTLTVTDSDTLTDTLNLAVTVTDALDAPVISTGSAVNVAENQTAVVDVQSTDQDGDTEGAGLTYSISGGADAALFVVMPATGVVTFVAPPDFESPADVGANNVYEVAVTVTASDTLTDVVSLAVTVTNVNEAPAITSATAVNAAENQTAVLDVQSTDPEGTLEGAGGLTYAISGGADAALFTIAANTGVLTFVAPPNFESPSDSDTNNQYLVEVTVSDPGPLTDVETITVTVTDATEPPVITSSAAVAAAENQTAVLDVQSTDDDGDTEGAGLAYAITGGADAALFSIVPGTGVLTFVSAPNFEAPTDAGANNVYDVEVTVTDSNADTDVQAVAVTVTNENEAPTVTSPTVVNAAENQTAVLDVQSTDPDGTVEGAGGLTYAITGGADAALFAIAANTGVLTFVAPPNFESPSDADTNNQYLVEVAVSDPGLLTDVETITVTVTDGTESPVITSPTAVAVAENQTAVLDVQSTDDDGDTEGAGLAYAITGGADAALFAIVPGTGVLTFASAPNFEAPTDAGANNVYDVEVTVTDSNTDTDVLAIAVTVTNENETPTITSPTAVNAAENQTAVLDVQSTDPDGTAEGAGGLTYAISGGADAADFTIAANTGLLTFAVAPDFEAPADADTNNVYLVEVTVSDPGLLTAVETITVTVTDVNEAPAIISANAVNAAENQTAVLDVQSTDPDGTVEGAGGLTYAISGGADAADFTIAANTGVLTFVSAPNFEAPADADSNNTYVVEVTVSDPEPLTGVQTITVTVTNVNEAPAITSAATVNAPENQTAVIDVQSSDPDGTVEGAGGLTYAITGGLDAGLFSIVANTGVLTFAAAPNFEGPTDNGSNGVYDVQVTVSDPGPLSAVQNLQVTVTDVPEAPIALDETFDTIGNTELRVDLGAGTTPNVAVATGGPANLGVLDNDTDSDFGQTATLQVDAITAPAGCADVVAPFVCATTNGGTVTMEANGSFSYLPPVGNNANDSFGYRVRDTTALTDEGTVTLRLFERVWYVDPGAAGDGRSTSPLGDLTTLAGAGGAGDSDAAGDYLFVDGDGSPTVALALPVELEANQHLLGEPAGLTVPVPTGFNGAGAPGNVALVAANAGNRPTLDNNGGAAVVVSEAVPVEIRGLGLEASSDAINILTDAALTGSPTLTIDDIVFRSAGGNGLELDMNAPTTGTLRLVVTDNTWNAAGTHTGSPVDVNRAAGTLQLDFSRNTGILATANVPAVLVNGGAVANTTLFGLAGNSVHQSSVGAGVSISNVTFDANTTTGGIQQVDGDNLTIGVPGDAVGGAGLTLATVQGNLFFDGLGVHGGTDGMTLSGTGGMVFEVTPAPPGGSGTSVIAASNGAALDLSNATIDLRLADLDGARTSNGSVLSLSSVAGQLTTDGDATLAKTGGTGTGVLVQNSTAAVSYAGSLNVTSGAGVSLVNVGTVSFTGGMTLSTATNAGFSATGGGTVTVTDPAGVANNTVTTTTATALNVSGTTIGAAGLTFESVTSTGSSSNSAIILANTGAGAVTITGSGVTSGSGGTLSNKSIDAVVLNNTDGAVTLRNMIIQDLPAATDATDPNDTRSGVDAIHGQLVDGGLVLSNVTIRRISDSAINGTTFGNLDGTTSWNGLDIRNSTLQNANRYHLANKGDAEQEGLVRILGITGTVKVFDTLFEDGARGLHFHSPTSGSVDITVQGCDFLDMNKEFTGLANDRAGYWGFLLQMYGSANAVVRIGDPAETSAALGNYFLNNPLASVVITHNDATTTGTVTAVVAQNIFTVTDHLSPDEQATNGVFDGNFPQGGVLFSSRGGRMEGIFAANEFHDAMHASGGVGNLSIIIDQQSDGEFIVRNNLFDGPWDFITELRASANDSGSILWRDNVMPFKNLGPAQIAGTELQDIGLASQPLPFEPYFVDVRDNGRLDLTIQNETIPDHDRPFATTQRSFYIRTQATGGTLNLEMDNNRATNGYRFDQAGPAVFNLFRDGSAAATVQGVLLANGNLGGGVNPNTNPPTVQEIGTITLSNTDPVLPSITIPPIP